MNNIGEYMNYLLLLLGVLGALFILKGLLKKLKNEKITIGTVGSGGYADQSFETLANGATWDPATSQGFSKPKKNRKSLFELGDIEDEITDEATMKKMKQDKIINYVSKNPSEAAKLINSWLKEDEYESE